jgi:hypothetical protein
MFKALPAAAAALIGWPALARRAADIVCAVRLMS